MAENNIDLSDALVLASNKDMVPYGSASSNFMELNYNFNAPLNDQPPYPSNFFEVHDDQSLVLKMAPPNTNINRPPLEAWSEQKRFEDFFSCSNDSYASSLELGLANLDEAMKSRFVGKGQTLKKLFMEPFAPGPLSLICHKIGTSIYVDDEKFTTEEKDQLQDVSKDKTNPDGPLRDSNKHPGFLNFCYPQLTLFENLIWHNKELVEAPNNSNCMDVKLVKYEDRLELPKMFSSLSYRIKPQDSLGGEAYLWEFHNMKMLIDLDIPIFGGGKFPSLSIRLSEENKPISVLTGMDILLDQLMCHVPETVLVYHEKGVVKSYEVVVKEDLPFMTGAEFEPERLKDITRNMYQIMDQKMTHQGHTYWLIREEGSEQLKLYDLTSLCPSLMKDPAWNPFLHPVFVLLYKIGTSLLDKTEDCRSEVVSETAYGLLAAAYNLLEDDLNPEYKTCVQYNIAGLYLMYNTSVRTGKNKTDQSNILEGLDLRKEPIYAKYMAIFNRAQVMSQGIPKDLVPTGSGNTLPNATRTLDCLEQALEHIAQEKSYFKGLCFNLESFQGLEHLHAAVQSETERDFHVIPDGKDDRTALSQLTQSSYDDQCHFLRCALLVKATVALNILANEWSARGDLSTCIYICKTALFVCGTLLSGGPQKKHMLVGTSHTQMVLFSVLSATISIHSTTVQLSEKIQMKGDDDTEITSYAGKDQESQSSNHLKEFLHNFMDLVSRHGAVKDWADLSNIFNQEHVIGPENNLLAIAHLTIDKLKTNISHGYNSDVSQYPPSQMCFHPVADLICRLAAAVMDVGNKLTSSLSKDIGRLSVKKQKGEDITKSQDQLDDTCKSGILLYGKMLSLLNKSDPYQMQLRTLINLNLCVLLKAEYSIRTLLRDQLTSHENIQQLIDTICEKYHDVFDSLDGDLFTHDGRSLYITSLFEYTNFLITFCADIPSDDVTMKHNRLEKKVLYLEAVARNLEKTLEVAGTTTLNVKGAGAQLLLNALYHLILLRIGVLKYKPARMTTEPFVIVPVLKSQDLLVNSSPRYNRSMEVCVDGLKWQLELFRLCGCSEHVKVENIMTVWKNVQTMLKDITIHAKQYNQTRYTQLKEAYQQSLLKTTPEAKQLLLEIVIEKLNGIIVLLSAKVNAPRVNKN